MWLVMVRPFDRQTTIVQSYSVGLYSSQGYEVRYECGTFQQAQNWLQTHYIF